MDRLRHFSFALTALALTGTIACSAGQASSSSSGDPSNDGGTVGEDGGMIVEDPDGGSTGRDGSATGTDGSTEDPPGEVKLTVSGDCNPDFRDLMVATNVVSYDSLAVVNANAPLSGSFTLQLVSGKKQLTISSTQRTKDKDVININAGGVVYTNLCNASGAGGCSYDAASQSWKNDAISGSATVNAYDPRNGKLDVVLTNVVLQSTQGTGLCRVSGTVKATRLGR